MVTILLFIVILGLLVFVHELGHFLTARFFGVKAEEFGFGFPPRMIGVVYDDVRKKYQLVKGNKEVQSPHTIYSLNWLPLGGFVRIKGEDGNEQDADSFVVQSAWKRVLIMAAGVVMNFFIAIVLFGLVFLLGVRQPIDASQIHQYQDVHIQIAQVAKNSSAEKIGLEPGDQILAVNKEKVTNLESVKSVLDENRGKAVAFTVDRLGTTKNLVGMFDTSQNTEEKFGIGYSYTATVKLPVAKALQKGVVTTEHVTVAILTAFGQLIGGLLHGTGASGVDLTGPVGIVYITKAMSELGLVYILQFAALLSVNLAIINILPIPALDGGRILFVIIEKIKGAPVKRTTEGIIHQVGFLLLIFLMVFITTRDVLKFELFQKILSLFN